MFVKRGSTLRINHIICLVLILMGSLQSCAEMDKTSDVEGPRKLGFEAAKEKTVYVGLITAESKFHPWMKEMFLSQDIFEPCFLIPNDQSIAILLRWRNYRGRWKIDKEGSAGDGGELMKCVIQQFEMWLAKRLSQAEEGGMFYLVESKDQLNLNWPSNGEKYSWHVRFEKKRRIFQ
ncbi:MAG: hypothetical protein IPJ71_09545 [Bdellovibrionales bacterium]|nr:hypothetical protein [Bdellovibrionales bacterium]